MNDQSSSSEQENESYENLNSESISTVLIGETKEEGEETEEINQEELDKEIEKELEEGVEAINQYLEEAAEFINAYQEVVGEARKLDEERECEGDERHQTDKEWVKEETADYTAEQLYEGLDERENDSNSEDLSEPNKEPETEKEIHTYQDNSEEIISELEEGMNEIEQHQVDPLIEEALEAEPEPMFNEKEIEQLQKLDLEEQFSEVHEKEEMEELIEWHGEQIEQEKEEELETQTDNSEEIISELEEGMNEIEQHQVDPLIEEALETDPGPMINEKEIEQLQELDLEEQFNEAHEKEEMEELIEWYGEQIEQEKEEEVESQTDNSEEIISELEEDFEDGMNEIEQHQVDPLIKEALETDPEPIVNEKELEKFQEMELEEQFQAIEFNDLIKDLAEQQEEDKIEQEKKDIEQTQEIIHQPTYLQEKLEEQEQELEMEYEEKDEVERHQVEAAIGEELETEPKPIIREEELEYIKNFEPEKQLEAELFYELIEKLKNKENEEKEEHEELSTEEKVAQIKFKLGMIREIKSGEAEVEPIRQEEVLEHETISPDVSEQNKRIEQEVLNEIDSGEEDSDQTAEQNYENLKKLYKQQTGKRPIYANLETKGFKQWLKQKKEAEKQEKTKQEQDLKEEQKNEEAWKRTLKNRIEEAREIELELKSKLIKLVEKYNELEKLIKKYSQLHNKAQRKKLSQTERIELNSLVKALLKLDPIKMELFLGLQEIKRYIDKDDYYYYEYWNNQRHYKVFSHFFTQLSQRYKSIKEVQKKEIIEDILKNWIEETSEEEISLEMKVVLIKILENYNELEELASNFMKLHKKEQLGQVSQSEKSKLRSLSKTLGKLSPIKIELFANMRAIKRYLNNLHLVKSSEEKHVNLILYRFFSQLSQKYSKLRKQEEFKAIIEKYKNIGSWKVVAEDYPQYSKITLIRMAQKTLGIDVYKKLLKDYSKQNKSSNQTIEIEELKEKLKDLLNLKKEEILD